MAKKVKKKFDPKKIEAGVRLMLEGMGEDPDREGLLKTPERVADFYRELTEGMWQDPKEHIVPLPGDSHDEMVLVKDISIASVCEHHLAPFVGKCHIAYIPKGGRIVGLSKARPDRRDLCPATAGAGASNPTDRQYAFRRTRTAGRYGRHRSGTHLHDPSWSQEARCDNGNFRCPWRIQKRFAYPGRGDVIDKRLREVAGPCFRNHFNCLNSDI